MPKWWNWYTRCLEGAVGIARASSSLAFGTIHNAFFPFDDRLLLIEDPTPGKASATFLLLVGKYLFSMHNLPIDLFLVFQQQSSEIEAVRSRAH